MTTAAANAALERMEADEAFALSVRDAGGPEASLELLQAEGFHTTAEEMRDATLDRFGNELTPEQLDALAGGITKEEDQAIATVITGGVVLIGAAAAAAV